MRTTADPRVLFREIDGTELADAGSYTFYVDKKKSPASVVSENEEFPRNELDTEKRTVKFSDFEGSEHEKELAVEALRENSSSHLADAPIMMEHDYDVLFIDRERDETYLVDTSRFGYKIVSEKDEEDNATAGGYIGTLDDAALRVR